MSNRRASGLKKAAGGAGVVPIANIIEYWNMNGNSNGYNGNDGADTNIIYPSGFIAESAELKLTSAQIDVSNTSSVFSFGDGTTDVPFSAPIWVKWDVITAAYFLSIRDTATSSLEYEFFYNGSSAVEVFMYSQNTATNKRTRKISFTAVVDTWYNFTFTYSGVQNEWAKVYANGVLGSQQNLGGTGYVAMQHTGAPLEIAHTNINSARVLNGQVDEVAIYDIELTQSQVTDLYNAGLAGTPIIS